MCIRDRSWIALAESYGLDMSGVKAWIVNFDWEKLLQGLRDNSGEILSTATQAANSVFGVVANIGFGLIFAIYILLNLSLIHISALSCSIQARKRFAFSASSAPVMPQTSARRARRSWAVVP